MGSPMLLEPVVVRTMLSLSSFLLIVDIACAGSKAPQASPVSSVATTHSIGPPSARVEAWRPLFLGVEYARAEAVIPRAQKVHAVRVNLKDPAIEFLVTPSNGDKDRDTDGMWTSKFLTRYKCQVAINASPFDPVIERDGVPQDVCGLSVSRGDCYSPPNKHDGALLISRDNKAWIATPPVDPNGAYNAVGGFGLLLKEGRNVASGDALHPRTAVGISKDKQFLYLVVIDGRQKGYSEGATTAETAEWMRLFGAYDALNLDGGGSTTLVISDGLGGARVLNRPINLGIPGMQRVVANHLGVFAQPLRKSPTH